MYDPASKVQGVEAVAEALAGDASLGGNVVCIHDDRCLGALLYAYLNEQHGRR